MNTNKLIALTAAAAFLFGAAAANASSVTPEVTVDYTDSTSNLTGNAPAITYGSSYGLGSGFEITESGGLPATNFLKTSPAGTCGSGCTNNTASDQINFDFTFTDAIGGTGTLDIDAVYTAKYSGAELGCSNSGSGESDCLVWEGSSAPVGGVLGNGSVTDTVDLDDDGVFDGSVVTLTFYNDEDWTITSQISGTFSYAPVTTPEPASIVLFLSGLAGLPLLRSRMNRKRAAAAAA